MKNLLWFQHQNCHQCDHYVMDADGTQCPLLLLWIAAQDPPSAPIIPLGWVSPKGVCLRRVGRRGMPPWSVIERLATPFLPTP
jgi:hypothetical protein